MSFKVRERVIFDVVDDSTGEVVTSAVERETADGVRDRLEKGALQHTPDPGVPEAPARAEEGFERREDDEPVDVGGSTIT